MFGEEEEAEDETIGMSTSEPQSMVQVRGETVTIHEICI